MSKDWDENSLSSLRIHELRDLARKIGVKCPTALKKEDLINQSMQILNGETEPYVAQNKKGRPNKSQSQVNTLMEFFMPDTVSDSDISNASTGCEYKPTKYEYEFFASMPEISYGMESENEKVEGLVEIAPNGVGIIRVNGFETSEDDVYIHDMLVTRNNLSAGDYVEAYAKRIILQRPRAVVQILSINKNQVTTTKTPTTMIDGVEYNAGSSILSFNNENAEGVFDSINSGVCIYTSAFSKDAHTSTKNKIYACVDPFKTYKDIYCCYNMAVNRACVLSKTTNVTIVINNLSAYFRALESEFCDRVNNALKLDKVVKEEIIKMVSILKKSGVTVMMFDSQNTEQRIKEFFKFELSQIVDYVL